LRRYVTATVDPTIDPSFDPLQSPCDVGSATHRRDDERVVAVAPVGPLAQQGLEIDRVARLGGLVAGDPADGGALKPLGDVLDMGTYESETARAGRSGKGRGRRVRRFIKAAIKGLIWYNPKAHDYAASPSQTWDELMSQARNNLR
jgi:hypothetical protein